MLLNKSSKVLPHLLLVLTFVMFFSALKRGHLCIRYVGTFRRCSAHNDIKKKKKKKNPINFVGERLRLPGNAKTVACWHLITRHFFFFFFLATSLLCQSCLLLDRAYLSLRKRQQSMSSMTRPQHKTASNRDTIGEGGTYST